MPTGGARNRSGPQPDPNSGRSESRGLVFTALPVEGYRGEIPEYPLPKMLVKTWVQEDKKRWRELDPDATEAFRERELQLWATAWTYPQACVWALHPWRWNAVAQWVRTSVLCESDEATASDRGSLHRFADQIGLTPAGLKENGWQIAEDKLAERRAEKDDEDEPDLRDRFTVVPDGTDG